SEQYALTHTAACEQTDPLSAPDGQHGVDCADAHVERLRNGLSGQRIDGLPGQPYPCFAFERTETVQWMCATVDNPAQHLMTNPDGTRPLAWNDPRARSESLNIACRHEVQPVAGEAHDLRFDTEAITGDDITVVTHRCLTTGCFQCQANHAGQ